MMKNYKEYVEKLLALYDKMCLYADDYSDKKKLKTHNKAVIQSNKLENEILKDQDLAEKVFLALMQNESIGVQLSAAACCVYKNGVPALEKMAEETLERIVKSGVRGCSVMATRTLGVWRGEIDPDKPW